MQGSEPHARLERTGDRTELYGHGCRHHPRQRAGQPDQPARRPGPGPVPVLGFAICGVGWLLLSFVPVNRWSATMFGLMLLLFAAGAVFVFINFLTLRQAVTPEPLLGRMTSTMRWLILLPAGPGALLGGWLGEQVGLRASLAFAGGSALLLAVAAWRSPVIWRVRKLPEAEITDDWIGAEASVRAEPRPGGAPCAIQQRHVGTDIRERSRSRGFGLRFSVLRVDRPAYRMRGPVAIDQAPAVTAPEEEAPSIGFALPSGRRTSSPEPGKWSRNPFPCHLGSPGCRVRLEARSHRPGRAPN